SLDPSVLLQPHQCWIESALVQVEQAIGDLLETCSNLVSMLWPHAVKRTQDDQVERALKQLNGSRFTRHSSILSGSDDASLFTCLSSGRNRLFNLTHYAEPPRRCY